MNGYNKNMIKEFLMQLAGELQMEVLGFDGKTAAVKVIEVTNRLRFKNGTTLLPIAEDVEFLGGSLDNDKDAERVAARETAKKQRAAQVQSVVAIIKMLDELEFVGTAKAE
jgi:hypothetical protein